MTQWVAFLRGINVGGNRKIPMEDLRRLCVGKTSGMGVRSYIASGNLLFAADGTAESLSAAIAEGIADEFGFDVPVLVLDETAMRGVLEGCPFPRDAGNKVHGYLCYGDPVLDQAGVDALKVASEEVAVVGQTVWLYAPEGIGRSKLAAKMERLLGVEATARNLNTIRKMVDMLEDTKG